MPGFFLDNFQLLCYFSSDTAEQNLFTRRQLTTPSCLQESLIFSFNWNWIECVGGVKSVNEKSETFCEWWLSKNNATLATEISSSI